MKTFYTLILTALALTLAPTFALADGGKEVDQLKAQFDMNNSATAGPASGLGNKAVLESVRTLRLTWNYSVHRGTTMNLRGSDGAIAYLPKNAIVRDCIIDVVTAPTSAGGAVIGLSTGQSLQDIKANAVFGSYTVGRLACTPVGTAATSLKMTADRLPSINVTGALLTAGKINVFIDYVLSTL